MRKALLQALVLSLSLFCLASLSVAQERQIHIDLPNVENDAEDLALTQSLRELFQSLGYRVSDEEQMNANASKYGIRAAYWDDLDLITALNRKMRHDAVLYFIYNEKGRRYKLEIFVFNAYTGELLAEFERPLKHKLHLSDADKDALSRGIPPILEELDISEYPYDIEIKIETAPQGVTVFRDKAFIGKTPLRYEMEAQPAGSTETWTLSYPESDDQSLVVSTSESGEYDAEFTDALDRLEREAKRASRKLGGSSFEHPIFAVQLGLGLSMHSLSSKNESKLETFAKDLTATLSGQFSFEFYPFLLLTVPKALTGLGLIGDIYFASDTFQLKEFPQEVIRCTPRKDSEILDCSARFLYVKMALNYKWQLQQHFAIDRSINFDFYLGFASQTLNIADNGYFRGSIYNGLSLGLRFSLPFIDDLRFSIGASIHPNFSRDNVYLNTRWGSKLDSSLGFGIDSFLSYRLWQGLYLRLDYRFSAYFNRYKGFGCLNPACDLPINSKYNDYYQDLILNVGYAYD